MSESPLFFEIFVFGWCTSVSKLKLFMSNGCLVPNAIP